jgi:hypothetical protein
MRVDSSSLAQAAASLQGQQPVQQAFTIAAIKDSLQMAEQTTLLLLQSVQPHLGQNVNVRA